jgi:hypothetical protein
MTDPARLLALIVVAMIGCETSIDVDVRDPIGVGDNPDDPPLNPDGTPAIVPAPHTRAARLSHREWENTVRDLLRLDDITGFTDQLPSDSYPAGFLFDNPGQSLSIDQTQWSGFQRAAEAAAELVVQNPAVFGRLVPSDGDDDARARAFIADFGRRAHRRPLSAEQQDRYHQVYVVGAGNHSDASAFIGGVRLLIEAFLQSPLFLYRVESSSTASNGVIPLDAYEVASRLSYALWNTMPDDVLFEVAAANQLSVTSEVEAEARRMLDNPRATTMVDHVMGQLWERHKLSNVRPAAVRYPDAPTNLGALAGEEARRFLASQFENDGSLADLLQSRQTFVNADLALIYGLDASGLGDEFEPVELDGSTRRGLLTQIAFLAQNSNAFNPDPIHRGVFIARRLLCMTISAPPANLPPTPQLEGPHTNREIIEAHTQTPDTVCNDCHTYTINPYGFPFEMYDAIGAVQTTDNGLPVNTATTPYLGADQVPVADAVELSDRLADHDEAHACFAKHWLSATLGRPVVDNDVGMITKLTADSFDGQSVKELLATLVSSPAFTARSRTELDGVTP